MHRGGSPSRRPGVHGKRGLQTDRMGFFFFSSSPPPLSALHVCVRTYVCACPCVSVRACVRARSCGAEADSASRAAAGSMTARFRGPF